MRYYLGSMITRCMRHTWAVPVYIFLIVLAIICLLPFYSMLIASTHSSTDISTKLVLLPGDDFLANYRRLMALINIWQGFLHSLLIATSATALALYFSALAGYSFSKLSFAGRGLLFACVLATMMIPNQLGIIGFFHLVSTLHMLNTYWPLILPSIANAFAIFFFRQTCETSVPTELIEAARMDGASELRIFHWIVLPLLRPALATLCIFLFISKWNDFLTPLIIIFDNSKQTLPVMVAMTKGQFATDYGAQYVGIVISIMPIMIVFALASRHVIHGITMGAIRG